MSSADQDMSNADSNDVEMSPLQQELEEKKKRIKEQNAKGRAKSIEGRIAALKEKQENQDKETENLRLHLSEIVEEIDVKLEDLAENYVKSEEVDDVPVIDPRELHKMGTMPIRPPSPGVNKTTFSNGGVIHNQE